MRTKNALMLVLAVMGGAVSGCESPMADYADRDAYRLITQRQRQTLGGASEVHVAREPLPMAITPEAYDKTPRTSNSIPNQITVEEAATRPAETAPATRPGTGTNNALDAILAATPTIDLKNMPELPQFPRPAPKGKVRQVFTLDDCFNYALGSSRDYKARKEDLYIAALAVTLQRHQFEPRLFAQTTVEVAGSGEKSDYASALNVAQTLGVRQRLPYGGEVVASVLAQNVTELRRVVSESQNAEAVLSANVPLLRGAGLVAQEDLIQAERDLVYEVREFERYRRAFLVQVASSYFNLVNQRAQVLNRLRSVNSYIFIRQRTQALFEAGRPRVTLLDVQRAAQSEFQARNDLVNTIEQYELAVDNFKLLLGMPVEDPLDLAPQYLSITPPDVTEAVAVALADRLRLDLQTVRDRVDDAKRGVKVAANNMLPDLNLTARAALSSDPNKKSVAVEGEQLDYSAGMVLNWPLDKLAERNVYRISQINLERSRRNVELTEDAVAVEVRSSLRRVRQQQYLVSLQRNNIELAQRRKEFADIQFKNGKIDNRDYLDAETALLDAQNRFATAVSSLQTATLQYLRDTDQLRVDAKGRLLAPEKAIGVEVTTRPGATTQPSR